MAKTLWDYYNEQEPQARQRMEDTYKNISDQRAAASQKYINDTVKAMSAASDTARKQYADNIAALPQQHQKYYDANAINQMIAEQQVAERMENLGLTNSGLNRTQQTALQVSRMNADNAVAQQQSAAARALERDLDNYLANLELQKAQVAAEENLARARDDQSLYADLYSNYQTNLANAAANAYNTDSQERQAKAKYAADVQMKQYDYLTKQYTQQQKDKEAAEKREKEVNALIYTLDQTFKNEGQEAYIDELKKLFELGKITAQERELIAKTIAKWNTATASKIRGEASLPNRR